MVTVTFGYVIIRKKVFPTTYKNDTIQIKCHFETSIKNIIHGKGGDFMKRVFLIVLDSFGIGEMPDAAEFHDAADDEKQ